MRLGNKPEDIGTSAATRKQSSLKQLKLKKLERRMERI